MEALGALGIIIVIFLIVAALLAFLIPFFVLKIMNDVSQINNKMSSTIRTLDSIRRTIEKATGNEDSQPFSGGYWSRD